MKKFAAAIIATAAFAQDWEAVEVEVDGSTKELYSYSKDWSSAAFDKNAIQINGNNSLPIQRSKSSSDSATFKPTIRGGSISYDVNVSGVNSGCVAGVYLVETDNSRCSPATSQAAGDLPMCKSIDAMQANRYGFESKAHPCSNGTCDAIS